MRFHGNCRSVGERFASICASLVCQVDLVAQGSTTDLLAGQFLISAGIVAGVAYEAQARLVSDRDVIWSAWNAATAPNVQFGADDMSQAVWDQVAAQADAVLATFKAGDFAQANQALATVAANADRLTELSMLGQLSGDLEMRKLGDSLAVATQQLTADISEADQAVAQLKIDLAAGVAGNVALIQVEQTARADGDVANATNITALAASVATLDGDITASLTAAAARGKAAGRGARQMMKSRSEYAPPAAAPAAPLRILIIGDGRHGKGTTAALLSQICGLTFADSSEFAAQTAVFPLVPTFTRTGRRVLTTGQTTAKCGSTPLRPMICALVRRWPSRFWPWRKSMWGCGGAPSLSAPAICLTW
jgi:hypothetical protein